MNRIRWRRAFRTSEEKARGPRGSRLSPHQAAVAPTASQASAAAAGTRYRTRPSSDRPRSAAPPPPQPRARQSLTLAMGRRRSPPPGAAAAGDIAAPRRGEDLNIPACTAPRVRHWGRRVRHCSRDVDARPGGETLRPGRAVDPTPFEKCGFPGNWVLILQASWQGHPHSAHPEGACEESVKHKRPGPRLCTQCFFRGFSPAADLSRGSYRALVTIATREWEVFSRCPISCQSINSFRGLTSAETVKSQASPNQPPVFNVDLVLIKSLSSRLINGRSTLELRGKFRFCRTSW